MRLTLRLAVTKYGLTSCAVLLLREIVRHDESQSLIRPLPDSHGPAWPYEIARPKRMEMNPEG